MSGAYLSFLRQVEYKREQIWSKDLDKLPRSCQKNWKEVPRETGTKDMEGRHCHLCSWRHANMASCHHRPCRHVYAQLDLLIIIFGIHVLAKCKKKHFWSQKKEPLLSKVGKKNHFSHMAERHIAHAATSWGNATSWEMVFLSNSLRSAPSYHHSVDFSENKVLYFILSVPTWYGSDMVSYEGVSRDDRRCSMATKVEVTDGGRKPCLNCLSTLGCHFPPSRCRRGASPLAIMVFSENLDPFASSNNDTLVMSPSWTHWFFWEECIKDS
jgi:hypothetical protein